MNYFKVNLIVSFNLCFSDFKDLSLFLKLMLEKKKKRVGGETSPGYLLSPVQSLRPGTKPATSVCALPGNRTHDPSVHGEMLPVTEPPGQGKDFFLK